MEGSLELAHNISGCVAEKNEVGAIVTNPLVLSEEVEGMLTIRLRIGVSYISGGASFTQKQLRYCSLGGGILQILTSSTCHLET